MVVRLDEMGTDSAISAQAGGLKSVYTVPGNLFRNAIPVFNRVNNESMISWCDEHLGWMILAASIEREYLS